MQRYTAAIDVWSVGCIMAELLTMLPESRCRPHERSALFPGSSCFPLSPSGEDLQLSAPYDQLSTIVRVLGTSQGDLSWIENEELRDYLKAMPHVERVSLSAMYPGASDEAIALLEWMLAFNPSERSTVQQALAHDFFHGMPELVAGNKPSVPRTVDFEDSDLSPKQLRHLILDEINSYQRYEVEMQRRPSLISDGRGPSLVGIAPQVVPADAGDGPSSAGAIGESDESARTTELSLASTRAGGSSAPTQASPQPAAPADTLVPSAKRARTRHATGTDDPRADARAVAAATAVGATARGVKFGSAPADTET
jgi:serine/threonine protein kinase